jgi:tetratricopeptide (TPR) repeat protein
VNLNANVKPGRNDPCGCGSGKKYKRCCGEAARTGPAPGDATPAELNQLLALANAGRHADAERKARQLLARQADSGVLWSVLGLALWMQGKDALHALEQTAGLLPNDAEAHGNLGTALRARGRLAEAVQRYRRALELKPDFAEAHNNLGSVLRDLGQLADAAASYRRALAVKPDFAVAHCNLGHAVRTLGDHQDAARHYRRAIELQPDFAAAHTGLGNALHDLGLLDDALASHRRSLDLRPDDAATHRNLGNVLLDLWRVDEAETCYRKAVALDPQFAEAHDKLGVALRLMGRAAAAEASCRRALELNPNLVDALISQAQLLTDRGEFAAAEEVYRHAQSIDPESPEAWAGVAGLRKMTLNDAPWFDNAERVAATPLPPSREAKLRYAIGKYFDDVGEFERAFTSYQRANELSKLSADPYDPSDVVREFDRLIERSAPLLAGRTRAGANASARPVFIVGMPRSGTTLMEQILAAHPAVCGAGEVPFWGPASKKYISTAAAADAAAADDSIDAMLNRHAGEYLRVLDEFSAAALRVVDKMPANFTCLGLIHAALPNARIIHAVRHPIDTCLSIYFQDFNRTHAYANDLANLAHYYGAYRRLMQHWRSKMPEGALLEVSYEALIADQETWSRKMVEFIGLPWDPRCLEFDRPRDGGRSILTFSQWQARQKISSSSVARWRRYERFVGPLERLARAAGPGDAPWELPHHLCVTKV